MKRLISIVTVMLLTISQANGKENTMSQTAISAQPQTVTQSAQVHVKHKRIVKSKIQRAIPFGIDDDNDDVVQNDDLQTGYRRRDLTKIEHEDGISDRVRWRLFLARQLAMLKYREING